MPRRTLQVRKTERRHRSANHVDRSRSLARRTTKRATRKPVPRLAQAMTSDLALERLVRAGCEERRLRGVLTISEALSNKIPSNRQKPRLKTLARDLRSDANRIDDVLRDLPDSVMGLFGGDPKWVSYRSLPNMLRALATDLAVRGERKWRNYTKRDLKWAAISAYVQSATGSPHDALVAALVNPDETCVADDLKRFRHRHKGLIAALLLDCFNPPAEKGLPTLEGPPRPTVVTSGPPPGPSILVPPTR